MPELGSHELACRRAAVARASQCVKRDPDNLAARDDLRRVRAELAEAKLTDYIARAVATAPELSPEQRSRLALLLAPAEADAA